MYKIGVDLGGTNISVGLVRVDENYNIVTKASAPTLAGREASLIVDDIASLCRKVCEDAGITLSEIDSIGVASPGLVNSKTGMVEYSNNLPFRDLPMAEMLTERLGVKKISLANDANAAALGEAVAGAAKGTSSSIMITLGTGIGGGVVIDNKLLTGVNFAGGELGHMVVAPGGVQCTCGRLGCWERYSSATALKRMTSEKIEQCRKEGRYTKMYEYSHVNGRTACDCMRAGDKAAKEVYDEYVYYLALGLTNVVNAFQPEVISIGGGISGEGQSLIDALMPTIAKERYDKYSNKHTELRIAELGNDAGIIGAAAL